MRDLLERERQPEASLSAFLEAEARLRGGSAAMISGPERVSFAALEEASRRVAGALRALGVKEGERIALYLPNVPFFLVLAFAAWRLGAMVVCVNTRYRSSELAYLLAAARPRVLALSPGFAEIDFARILAGVDAERLSSLEILVVCGEGMGEPPRLPRAAVVTESALAAAAPDRGPAASADALAILFPTSGTTRAPKLAVHRQGSIVRHAREVARVMAFDAPDAVTLTALPLCAVFGFSEALAALAGGGPQVLLARWDGAEAARLVRAHRVTHLLATDDMLKEMLAASSGERPFPSLRRCGFALFNPAIDGFLAEAERRGLPLIGLYGMSEILAAFSVRQPEEPAPRRLRPGGVPVSRDARVRIRDETSGTLLPPGREGLVEIRAPSAMIGYWQDRDATREAFTEDGYLRTGDYGFLDEDGGFVYLARAGDVLRLGGFLVAPAEIEAHLEKHPQIRGAQVVGVVTPEGPRAVAFVLLHESGSFDEEEMRRFCGAALARYKVPLRILPLAEFPVTLSANGTKIERWKLRAMAQALFA
jgi:fatty-acyl-CoA synthase